MRARWPFFCAALAGLWVAGCNPRHLLPTYDISKGNAARGRERIVHYQCSTCHSVPGVPEAGGIAGPPLHQIGSRSYLAGKLHNTPQNLVRWLLEPQDVDPGTAMPDLNLSEQEALDIAAYLRTLR